MSEEVHPALGQHSRPLTRVFADRYLQQFNFIIQFVKVVCNEFGMLANGHLKLRGLLSWSVVRRALK